MQFRSVRENSVEIAPERRPQAWTQRFHEAAHPAATPLPDAAGALADRALLAAVVGTALLFPVLHLYSLWVIGRFFAAGPRTARAARTKALAALVLDAAALVAAVSMALHLAS